VIETVSGGGWNRRETMRLAIVAIVPFGSFTNGKFLKRKAASIHDDPAFREPGR